jgi:hypothetical protein
MSGGVRGGRKSADGLSSRSICFVLTAVNVIILLSYTFMKHNGDLAPHGPTQHIPDPDVSIFYETQNNLAKNVRQVISNTEINMAMKPLVRKRSSATSDCDDDDFWCCPQRKLPAKSHFGFAPADDEQKWYDSCRVAQSGQQVLLSQIMKEITHPYDFLDGDVSFQLLHKQVDEFMGKKDGFRGRMSPDKAKKALSASPMSYGQFYEKAPFTKQEHLGRVPILMSGFMKYSGYNKDFLRGQFQGFEGIGLKEILKFWDDQKRFIPETERFILITALNENWGFLSTSFPGRTKSWGRVDYDKYPSLKGFLDDPRLLMLVIGQHTNISHPKLLLLPRGLPDSAGFTNHAGRMLYDTMRLIMSQNVTKNRLVFTVSSSFGFRKQIVQCVKDNVPDDLFDASGGTGVALLSRKEYLLRASASRFSLAPPGLGYDTFRLWELLTMGVIPIIERGVGFDRTLHQLPALLVEDYALTTKELLREAYIEAVYRASEFKFERLKQSVSLHEVGREYFI